MYKSFAVNVHFFVIPKWLFVLLAIGLKKEVWEIFVCTWREVRARTMGWGGHLRGFLAHSGARQGIPLQSGDLLSRLKMEHLPLHHLIGTLTTTTMIAVLYVDAIALSEFLLCSWRRLLQMKSDCLFYEKNSPYLEVHV